MCANHSHMLHLSLCVYINAHSLLLLRGPIGFGPNWMPTALLSSLNGGMAVAPIFLQFI